MLGVTHFSSGIAIWLSACSAMQHISVNVSADVIWLGAAACSVGALLPDIDHPSSAISRSAWPVTAIISKAMNSKFGHRGVTHYAISSVACLLLIPIAVTISSSLWWIPLSLCAGYLIHILGDACTVCGVPIFGPWDTRNIGIWRPMRFKTGRNGFYVELWLVQPFILIACLLSGLSLLS